MVKLGPNVSCKGKLKPPEDSIAAKKADKDAMKKDANFDTD
jgi:hypothetical protein